MPAPARASRTSRVIISGSGLAGVVGGGCRAASIGAGWSRCKGRRRPAALRAGCGRGRDGASFGRAAWGVERRGPSGVPHAVGKGAVMLVITTSSIEGKRITQYLGLVSGDAI